MLPDDGVLAVVGGDIHLLAVGQGSVFAYIILWNPEVVRISCNNLRDAEANIRFFV